MKFYIRNPDKWDLTYTDVLLDWLPDNGVENVDWNLSIDKNKMGGAVCATFMNEEMASLFILKYSDWVIPEPPDVAPVENSYSYSEEGFDPNEPIR